MKLSQLDASGACAVCQLFGERYASAHETVPTIALLQLRDALKKEGIELPHLPPNKIAELGAIAREKIETANQDPQLKATVEELAAVVPDAMQPQVQQEIVTVVAGGAVLITLAVLCKLEFKNGKWTLHKGLPEFEKTIEAIKGIF